MLKSKFEVGSVGFLVLNLKVFYCLEKHEIFFVCFTSGYEYNVISVVFL